ncbi:cation diffusion facilitator family transporter [Mesorhizobium sp. NBSH29]|uniref:cation diffusion facilitator family transporter n=1 Tax=Mesorhizobium sp. NBSH29 TaxID=2654249 RepID=UPI0018963FE3|nr:cation diffusion facilitator family transporter [Mesorhizobium sp. NBSH29]QPC85327.1 cation diffusion facilitator family transporter [Mesorhizobium sp. NBSH29]
MSVSNHRVARLAAWSIGIALVVFSIKSAAWWITGSVALFSDALESIVNVIASGAALYAIHLSHKPADDEHPFGHHKAEYFSAVLEGVLIVVAALLILAAAWQAWDAPQILDRPWAGLLINGLATAINLAWALVLLNNGRKERSPALIADGQHIMTDVVTSVGVIVGLVGAVVTGWAVLDPLLAIIVALNILWQGWKVIGSSVSGLMDVAVDKEAHFRIRDIISVSSSGALEVHDLKTRLAGRATFIEFHLVVDAGMTVGESHAICDRIEDALKADIPGSRITIHVEPDDEAKLPLGTTAVPFA